jgi:flagellar biosynthetic protein FlhB
MSREGEPIHPATPRRREAARAAGQVPVSRDLTGAVLLIVVTGMLFAFGPAVFQFLVRATKEHLTVADVNADPQHWAERWQATATALGEVLMPILAGLFVFGLAAHLIQTRFLFRSSAAAPDVGRINPLTGLRQLFSADNAAHAGFAAAKMFAVVAVGAGSVYAMRAELMALPNLAPAQVAAAGGAILLRLVVYVAIALFVLALAAYAYQRWRFECSIRMTTQELREEIKNQSTDPQIAARRRRARAAMAKSRAPGDAG